LGLNTSANRPELPLTSLPPMKWPISRIVFSLYNAGAVGTRGDGIAQLCPDGKPAFRRGPACPAKLLSRALPRRVETFALPPRLRPRRLKCDP
jgi:hypothetical protein